MKRKTLLTGTAVLSIAALIAKILSAVYRIPFQNLVGNTGFYIYQQIYPIYGIGMTFALNGFPVYISKVIAKTKKEDQGQVIANTIRWLSWLGLILFLGLEFGATQLATWMGDPDLTPLIQVVAWMFLTMPWLATMRGYFQGNFNMLPTATSQVIEQLVRVGVIILAAYLYTRSRSETLYHMGAWAMSGAVFAALAAIVVILPPYRRDKPSKPKKIKRDWSILRGLLIEGGSFCLFTALLIVLQLVDSFTVKKGLVAGGMIASHANSIKGIYDRGQPIVQLGLVIVTSLTTALLPQMAQAFQTKNQVTYQKLTQTMWHLGIVFSSAITIGLIVIMPFLNRFLFGDMDQNTALVLYLGSIFLMSVIYLANSQLQSVNQVRLMTVILIIGVLIKALINQPLVQRLGVSGASIGTLISLGFIAIGMVFQVKDHLVKTINFKFCLKVIGALAVMTLLLEMIIWLMPNWQDITRLQASLWAIGLSVFGGLIYIIEVLEFKILTPIDWQTLGIGARIYRWWEKRRNKNEIR